MHSLSQLISTASTSSEPTTHILLHPASSVRAFIIPRRLSPLQKSYYICIILYYFGHRLSSSVFRRNLLKIWKLCGVVSCAVMAIRLLHPALSVRVLIIFRLFFGAFRGDSLKIRWVCGVWWAVMVRNPHHLISPLCILLLFGEGDHSFSFIGHFLGQFNEIVMAS